ncbi:unnamed protein product [Euphydryas editha]|uniref:HTH CENPB-type domain-containing protein n=1 Tax=Euphydryas editha TaxID=104508 RepID=A0AAU9U320_EUPED|nr:unnamed protein product [Euphydryas editha]
MPKRKLWDPEAMKKAVEAVRTKEMGYKKAVKLFNVPRATLKDYVKKSDKPIEDIVSAKMGRKPILPVELEEELVGYCLQMEKNYYGVTASDLKRMAFQLAIRNNIPHPFSLTKKKAGKKWMKLFMARHPNLSFRQPQSLSRARVQGFTAENVKSFFAILKPELQKINFNPNKIFNVDETGISIVQHKVRKIITAKASGQFIPPLMVFPRKNMKAELLDGAPPGTIGGCHPSGWIQPELFTKWLRHFVSIVKPSKEDPVVLVLDGHYSHTRNLDVIDIGRDNGVSIICLPPHSTDHMQPLDVSFIYSFTAQTRNNRRGKEKKRNSRKKRVRNLKKNTTGSNKKRTKKRLKNGSSGEDTSDEEPILVSFDEEDSDDNDAECLVCQKFFSQDTKGEKWIRCTKCFQWMHEDCVENPGVNFTCAFCFEN